MSAAAQKIIHPRQSKSDIVCFWCRRRMDSADAAVKLLYNADAYDPCLYCYEKTGDGVWVIEFDRTPSAPTMENTQPHMQDMPGIFPTGRWCVVKIPAALHLNFPEAALQQKRMLMTPQQYGALMSGNKRSKFMEFHQ